MNKEELSMTFITEEELTDYLKANPQYEINQKTLSASGSLAVKLYVRAYAETRMNPGGYRCVTRWLTESETQEYLASKSEANK